MSIIAVAALTMLIIFLSWTTSTPYEPLFSELSTKDAGEIIEKLKERSVKYTLKDGGKTILVPARKVYELRLDFAREGLPESGPIGYEIFDNQELGVTEFRQKIAYKRALEGELARTIRSIESVERASVLIVIPKERLFEKDQQLPTASVQLKLRRKSMPPQMTIEAIAHLVASSIEGLEPENVTITDTRGRILSRNQDPASVLSLTSNQLEFKRKVEEDLARKALQVLELRVGPGNATVQVTAELNWDQVEKKIQQVDPERTATISEEISEQSTPADAASGGTGNANASSTLANYETSKTVEHIVAGVGNIRHLSVAVMINNKREVITTEGGETEQKSVPRDPGELNQLSELVKRAVGYRDERNDQFSIVNMEFNPDDWEKDLEEPATPFGDLQDILEKGFILLTIIAAILVVRSLMNQARQRSEEIEHQIRQLKGETDELTALGEASESEAAGALAESKAEQMQEEVIMADEFFKAATQVNILGERIQDYVKKNPDDATKLLKVWLMEDGEE